MRSVINISEKLNELQDKFDSISVPVETIELYLYFYEKHKDKYGSYKGLPTDKYCTGMDDRYDYCFKKMDQTYRILEKMEKKDNIMRLMWYI